MRVLFKTTTFEKLDTMGDPVNRDIIVIGASAGGIEAVTALVGGLPAGLQTAVFVVVHTSSDSPGHMGKIFNDAGALPARLAEDGEEIRPGTILVAPPDHHLLLTKDRVLLSKGPRENRSRPAIDPLFRSAAAALSSRVTGVILTGMLDDGSAGLAAIKRCGGVAVVQDPEDACFPDMPRQALKAVEADYRLPLREIAAVLTHLTRQRAPAGPGVPIEIVREVQMAAKLQGESPALDPSWTPSAFSCPDCGGVLQTAPDEKVPRYRCRVGHAYTASHLAAYQKEQVEESLWAAIRRLEEHASLLVNMAERATGRTAESYRTRAEESLHHAQQLRSLLLGAQP